MKMRPRNKHLWRTSRSLFPKRADDIQANRDHVKGWADLVVEHDNIIAELGGDLKKKESEEKDILASLERVRTEKLVIQAVSWFWRFLFSSIFL